MHPCVLSSAAVLQIKRASCERRHQDWYVGLRAAAVTWFVQAEMFPTMFELKAVREDCEMTSAVGFRFNGFWLSLYNSRRHVDRQGFHQWCAHCAMLLRAMCWPGTELNGVIVPKNKPLVLSVCCCCFGRCSRHAVDAGRRCYHCGENAIVHQFSQLRSAIDCCVNVVSEPEPPVATLPMSPSPRSSSLVESPKASLSAAAAALAAAEVSRTPFHVIVLTC